MRRTGRLAADVLSALKAAAVDGASLRGLDDLCFNLAVEAGAYPSPLGYGSSSNPFPSSFCASVNDEICHGIPDDRRLTNGDIVSLDVTVFREGVHGDTCATVIVGKAGEAAELLVRSTEESLAAAIACVRPGASLSVIGEAIEAVAERHAFGVVRDFVGHGIGREFHAYPSIPHYRHHSSVVLEPGMTFTIEPMVTLGSTGVEMLDDGWTAVTDDRSLCAQFEHTILVTDEGREVLTSADPWVAD